MLDRNSLGLDLDVARRQALGTTYGRPDALKARTDLVKAGVLRLAPHKDWKGNLTDWTADPFGDRNWRFQHHTLRWLNPLRWSALDGDEQARREWLRVVRSWATANLPPEKKPGEFAWKDMADGNRAIQLSLGSLLVADEDVWFRELLEAHRDWLLDERNFARGNHGLHQLTGLFVVSSTLRDSRAVQTCIDRLERHFLAAFDEEGGNDEASTVYHVLNMSWWQAVWNRLDLEGQAVPAEARRRLEAAGVALAHLAQPDGSLPQIGDSARRSVKPGVHPMVDYVESGGARGEKPLNTAFVMKRGYAAMRSGWGESRPLHMESHGLMRFGSPGGGHAHQDLGSLHVYAAGRRWLIDSGFHSYQSKDPVRQHLESRSAHNLPHVKWKKYDPQAQVTIERFVETDALAEAVMKDPGYEGVVITRRVMFLKGPDCWIVWDRATGPTPLRLVQHWHSDVGLSVRVHDRGFELYDTDAAFTMSWVGPQAKPRRHIAKPEDLRGWIGTRWKTLEAGALITAESSPTRPELVLIAGVTAPHDLAVVRSFLNTSGVLTVRLMRGPRVWHVEATADDVVVRELDRTW